MVRVAVERANVRETASTSAAIIATLDRGTDLEVLGTTGTWYRVRLRPSNREGFIAMSTVDAVAAGAPATPAAPPAASAPPPAQAAPRPAAPAPRPPAAAPRAATATPWHLRAIAGADVFTPTAVNTFDAILGTTTIPGFAAGVDLFGGALPRGIFARVGFGQLKAEGERVVVANGAVFPTGIPLTVKITPVQLGAGMRFKLTSAAQGALSRMTAYAGGGLSLFRYQEVSDFADDGEDEAESFKGLSLFGGLDFGLTKLLSVGAEAEWRQVSGFGTGGVSAAFEEDQLGGVSIKFLIGINR